MDTNASVYEGQTTPAMILEHPPTGPNFHTLRSRRRKRHQNHAVTAEHCPRPSASSSSWGAVTDEVSEDSSTLSDKSVDDEAERPYTEASLPTSPPPKKRRHLHLDDVGRFASMSIDPQYVHVQAKIPVMTPSSINVPQSPVEHTVDHVPQGVDQLSEMRPTAVEEPSEADSEMRVRRGPQTFELEKDRFVVTSLSDSSSDEEDEQNDESQRVSDALSRATSDEVAEVLASDDDKTQYVINGELVSRLQMVDWQRKQALSRDRAASHLSKGPKQDADKEAASKSALILWKSPENFSLEFGRSTPPSSCPHSPVVYDDGDYAYVRRPHATTTTVPSQHRSTQSLTPSDAMDIDM